MNRAARRHLLAVVDMRAAPLLIVTARAAPDEETAIRAAIRQMREARCVLPACASIEIIRPRAACRAIPGRSGRRRGIRDKLPPMRIVKAEPGMWKRAALAQIFKRDAVYDRATVTEP